MENDLVIYLTRDNIINLNYASFLKFGGNFNPPDNLHHPDAFYYLLEMVQNDDYYPDMYDKASLYAYNINANHVFLDGNKRTSLMAALLFLDNNFYKFTVGVSQQDMIDFGLSIANGSCSQACVKQWFVERGTILI